MVRICHYGENFAEVFSTGKIRMIELPSTDDIIIIIIIIINMFFFILLLLLLFFFWSRGIWKKS